MSIRGLGVAVAVFAVCLLALVPSALADSCPNAAYRTGPSASLPDCRAYELVTPPFLAGNLPVMFTSSVDESHLIFQSLGSFGEASASFSYIGSDYLAARGESGWTSTPFDPPLSQFAGGGPSQDVNQDFSKILMVDNPLSAKRVDQRLYMLEPGGPVSEVGPMYPPAVIAAWTPGVHVPVGAYVGASADLSHVLFELGLGAESQQASALWPTPSGERPQQATPGEEVSSLYEYVGSGNSVPRVVGVDDSGHLIGDCGDYLGADHHYSREKFNAVSASGAAVFFTARCGVLTDDEVYARIEGSRTVDISEPSAADCSACDTTPAHAAGAIFMGASRDGSKAFFLSSQPLLGGDSTQNLYLYDFDAPAGQRVVRVSAGDPAGANVQGVARISEDGSHVYFVATGVLASTPNSQGQSAQEGADNLYVYEPDPAHPGQFETVFIASLSPSDSEVWNTREQQGVEVTPDGRFLLFTSSNGLTADCVACSGEQLYRYDAQTGGLVRVSIGEDGFDGNGTQGSAGIGSGSAVGRVDAKAQPLAVSISDDGAYVFFVSSMGLTPQALNEVCVEEVEGECYARARNIYEYHEGQVYLLSDGQDRHVIREESHTNLIGASPSGSNVFFESSDQLAPQDTNTLADFYDARIDGGSPAPAVPASCRGEECQGAPSPTPSGQLPGSAAFAGPGNPAPPVSVVKKSATKPHVKAKKKKKKKKARGRHAARRARAHHASGKGR